MSKALVKEQWVYPNSRKGNRFGHEVPDDFKNDYLEACEVYYSLVRDRRQPCLEGF